ncbi:MAG: ImmA/IrrE family metallo-endopeptidase [Cellvibrionaceae bacterium]|nr:ImmA/IrrE family metallo-endopeptidase [Cellvibrionaceae bacterium]
MTNSLLNLKDMSPKELLEKFDMLQAPIDVEALCDKIGVPVTVSTSLKKLYSGEISLDSNGEVSIWVNAINHQNRKRFTLAHELGHLINDIIPHIESHKEVVFEDPATNFQRSGAQKPEEYRANTFAAELLMPEELIVKEGKKVLKFLSNKLGTEKVPESEFIEKMTEKFLVSHQAMEIRLKVIGIL